MYRSFATLCLLLSVITTVFAWDDPASSTSVQEPPRAVRGESGEGVTPVPPSNGPRETDEYGSFSVNGYLGGLGASTRYLEVPYNTLFNQNFDGSIEMWVRPTDFPAATSTVMIAKGATGAQSFLWGFTGSTAGLMFFRIGTTVFTNTGGAVVGLNTWTHVAVTWSGGPTTFTVNFYVNGNLSGSPSSQGATFDLGTDSVYIGASQAFPSNYFRGDIDEVRFWTTEQPLAEIRQNRFVGVGDAGAANAGNALVSSQAYNGLVSSWTFNTTGTAFDDISGFHGAYRGGATAFATPSGQPIPYNFALLCPGGVGDYTSVPTSTVFSNTFDGSIEAWVRLNAVGVLQPIFQKGSSFAATTLAFYVTAGNKVGINIGSHNYISTGPTVFTANRWYHVAATWTGGPNFTVTLYVNGVQDDQQTFNLAMPTNTDTAWVGRYYSTSRFNGYIDELRMWSSQISQAQIVRNMFVSGRSLLSNSALTALWNFDGNLNNFTASTGINASFANGGTNNSRFSAYVNEGSPGAIGTAFMSHATVINRGGSPNPFPGGFTIRAPFKAIPDNVPAGITDTLVISPSIALTTVEAFVAIEHTYIGDLLVSLRAPNGQSRRLTNLSGGSAENILSFFSDGFSTPTTSSTYLPPWGQVQPVDAFGSFNSANSAGNWILSVSDNANIDVGWLKGWGLRFNNSTTVEQISSTVPEKYELFQNFPNPFNPATAIEFSLTTKGRVKLTIYDIVGREVATVVNGELPAGTHKATFDARSLSSGTYFYRLEAGSFVQTKKMLLLK
jgi:subtilisin-like proprotein convertase family protein